MSQSNEAFSLAWNRSIGLWIGQKVLSERDGALYFVEGRGLAYESNGLKTDRSDKSKN